MGHPAEDRTLDLFHILLVLYGIDGFRVERRDIIAVLEACLPEGRKRVVSGAFNDQHALKLVFVPEVRKAPQGRLAVQGAQVFEVEPDAKSGDLIQGSAPLIEREGCGIIDVVFDQEHVQRVDVTHIDFQSAVLALEKLCFFDAVGPMEPHLKVGRCIFPWLAGCCDEKDRYV